MKSLATGPVERISDGSRLPPGVDEHDINTGNTWISYKIKCWVRKLLFLPATPEIGILADMVSQLRREAEAVLERRVKGVAISSPDRVRLTVYEIKDILDYLWMEDLVAEEKKTASNQLFTMVAAAAGYGDGLCPSYTDAYRCEEEENQFPSPCTLHLDFSNHNLSGSMEWKGTARRGWAHAEFVELGLGADYIPGDLHEKKEYWYKLADLIKEFVKPYPRPEKVYATGESITESLFLEAVDYALDDLTVPFPLQKFLGQTPPTAPAELFQFLTSMGVAEFAKRRQEGMAICQLLEQCRDGTGTRAPQGSEEL